MKQFKKISRNTQKGLFTLFALWSVICLLIHTPVRHMLQNDLTGQTQTVPANDEGQSSEATLNPWNGYEAVMPVLEVSPQHQFFIAFAFEYFTPLNEFASEVRQAPPLMHTHFFKVLFRNIISLNAP